MVDAVAVVAVIVDAGGAVAFVAVVAGKPKKVCQSVAMY